MTFTSSTQRQLFGETDGRHMQVIRLDQVRRAPTQVAATTDSTSLANSTGTWTAEEHERFLEGLNLYPSGPWNRIAEHVGTRTRRQVLTHAQKYRQRLHRHERRVARETRVDDTLAPADAHSMTVLSVVVSPMPPTAVTAGSTSEMPLDPDAVAISLPDLLVLDNQDDTTPYTLPPLNFDLFLTELAHDPFFDGFDMTAPGAEFEPLQLQE